MRVLAGILRHGENEAERSLLSLLGQTGVEIDYFVLENLPNKEAHEGIFSEFMDRAKGCDLFLKLDADMVLRTPTALQEMIGLMDGRPHLAMDVWDWPSQLFLPAIHLYQSDVRWKDLGETLHVDKRVQFMNGKTKIIARRTVTDHMPDPSPFQAFRYGIHKALKARDGEMRKAVLHATVIANIARQWMETGDERRRLMLCGVAVVAQGQAATVGYDYAGEEAKRLFDGVMKSDRDVVNVGLERMFANKCLEFYLRWARNFEPDEQQEAA